MKILLALVFTTSLVLAAHANLGVLVISLSHFQHARLLCVRTFHWLSNESALVKIRRVARPTSQTAKLTVCDAVTVRIDIVGIIERFRIRISSNVAIQIVCIWDEGRH